MKNSRVRYARKNYEDENEEDDDDPDDDNDDDDDEEEKEEESFNSTYSDSSRQHFIIPTTWRPKPHSVI
ncbi:hypothetical protein E2C01_058029 [Portunus trituberculatus]|uniref:Uncharacterized protein n=1 Tax=Portunus trituberculatus TaxID=210409 RepID=A0A5B7GUI5_PORTR|nr:hypothetical protein [Portunus trituberculatus]